MRRLKARYRRYFSKNANAAPVPAHISGISLIGYTIDYQCAFGADIFCFCSSTRACR
ncbi:hypothetical protein B0H19DRAFT_1159741 [Mycena capillaripes]|nr:hypothetical protein B0H19DRAFT_1159741 [Mycena capillaripes]